MAAAVLAGILVSAIGAATAAVVSLQARLRLRISRQKAVEAIENSLEETVEAQREILNKSSQTERENREAVIEHIQALQGQLPSTDKQDLPALRSELHVVEAEEEERQKLAQRDGDL